MNDPTLLRSFEHAFWANRRTLSGLLRATPPGAERALKLMAHVFAAERVWLARLHGDDSSSLPIWPEWPLGELEARLEANERGYRELLASLPDEMLDSAVEYRNSKGDAFRTPVRDILVHVAAHGTYHRGQIATIVRAAGGESVATDFIVFSRERSS